MPPQQSESIAADLAAHGIRHAYLAFEGESHGFRKAETMIASLEAELSFYGQILGFTPPGVPELKLTDAGAPARDQPCGRSGPGRAAGRANRERRPALAGELGGAGLADDGDPDLARVGQLLLDLLGDVPRDHLGLDVVDRVRHAP